MKWLWNSSNKDDHKKFLSALAYQHEDIYDWEMQVNFRAEKASEPPLTFASCIL
jgi:hypothetical protein